MAPALQYRTATQRPRVPAARAGGGHAGLADAPTPSEPNWISTACCHAPLQFCPDHSMGAGQFTHDPGLLAWKVLRGPPTNLLSCPVCDADPRGREMGGQPPLCAAPPGHPPPSRPGEDLLSRTRELVRLV